MFYFQYNSELYVLEVVHFRSLFPDDQRRFGHMTFLKQVDKSEHHPHYPVNHIFIVSCPLLF